MSDFKTGHIHGGMENRLQMRRHGTTQLDLSITFFRFSLSPSFSLASFLFFFFFFILYQRIKDEDVESDPFSPAFIRRKIRSEGVSDIHRA